MAAPNVVTDVTIVSASRDGTVAQLHWRPPAAGDAPTFYTIDVQEDGGDWTPVGRVDHPNTAFTYVGATSDVPIDFRVVAGNADGVATAVATGTVNSLPSTVVGDSLPAIRFVIAVGEYVAGTANLTQLSSTLGGQSLWGRINEQSYPPYWPTTCLVWNHVGTNYVITNVEPNQPATGQTRITLAVGHGRQAALEFDVKIAGTGRADLDNPDHIRVRAINATQVIIPTFAASGTASAGTLRLPSLDNYRGDNVVTFAGQGLAPNGNTDSTYTGSGGFPSSTFGAEHELLVRMQEQVLASASPEDLVVYLQVGGGAAGKLRGRVDANGTRWMRQFESDAVDASSGRRLSMFRELRNKLRDLRGQIRSDPTQADKPRIVDHLWMSFGLNDGNSANVFATPRTRTVSSVSISGADAIFTVTSAIGLSQPSPGTRLIARISGFTNDTLGVNGTTQEIEILSTTTFKLTDKNATGLAAPTGAANVIISDPIYTYKEDLRQLTEDIRQVIVDELETGQEPTDFPVVYTAVDPRVMNDGVRVTRRESQSLSGEVQNARIIDFTGYNRDIELGSLVALDGADAITQIVTADFLNNGSDILALFVPGGGLLARGWKRTMYVGFTGSAANDGVTAYISDVADNFLRFNRALTVGSITAGTGQTITLTRKGIQASGFFYDANGYREMGTAIFDAKRAARTFSIGSARRPAVIVALAGHSYGVGVSNIQFDLNNDPALLSPSEVGGSPAARRKVWVHDRQTLEDLEIGNRGPTGRANVNRDPVWNRVNINPLVDYTQVSVHPSMMLALSEQFPDEDIHLFSLSSGGATLANYDGFAATIQQAQPEATRVLFRMAGRKIRFDRPFTVTIANVTGLTPTVNGVHTATPLWSGFAADDGTEYFSIPVQGVTGIAGLTGATATFPEGIWDPSVTGSLFDTFRQQFLNFTDFLWDANRIPDVRLLTVMLGVNDAAFGTQGQFPATLDNFVGEMRELLQTRGKPREFGELPIVWLQPIQHNDVPEPTATRLPEIRAALEAKSAADPWMSLLSIDETNDIQTDRARISADRIHPSFAGYINLGYQLGRAGVEAIPGWRSRHPITLAQP